MAKRFRKLQRISTIPILAAILLSSNPGTAIDQPGVNDTPQTDAGTDISIALPETFDST